MGGIAISLFVGVSYLAVHMHARPSQTVSVISEIARGTFPAGSATSFLYFAVQGLTFAILVLAANTSYQGFPRLGAVLARDRFFPRQFVNLGDRLVHSNGIIVLSGLAAFLIWIVQGERARADPPVRDRRLHRVHALSGRDGPLLAPAPTSAGWRGRDPQRHRRGRRPSSSPCSSIQTKFLAGAWAVTVAIPLL